MLIWGIACPPQHMACEEMKDSLLYRKTHFLFQVQFPFLHFCWHVYSLSVISFMIVLKAQKAVIRKRLILNGAVQC